MNGEMAGGTPLPISEVRMVRRKRGGQPGNCNRLRHGGFSREARARRDAVRALVAETEALIMRIGMVARARKTLKVKENRLTSPNAGRSERARGASVLRVGGNLESSARFATAPHPPHSLKRMRRPPRVGGDEENERGYSAFKAPAFLCGMEARLNARFAAVPVRLLYGVFRV